MDIKYAVFSVSMGEPSFGKRQTARMRKPGKQEPRRIQEDKAPLWFPVAEINGLQHNANAKFIFRKTPSSYTTDDISVGDKSGIKRASQKATATILI